MKGSDQQAHQKLKICVSAAADAEQYGADTPDIAKELGREIARHEAILMTGAVSGFSLWAAAGAKEEQGVSIGVSPASSQREHVNAYRMPLDHMDMVLYTGFGYAGRDLLLTRSSDAVLIGCGLVETIHAFTIAFAENKPIGILEGDWHIDETIRSIIEQSDRNYAKIVYGKDPKELTERVIDLVEKDKTEGKDTFSYKPPSNQ